MFKIAGVTHWSIGVNDLEQSERFYRDVLGLEFWGRLGGGHMSAFRAGDVDFLLCRRTEPLHRTAEQEYPLHTAFRLEPEEWENAARSLHEQGIPLAEPVFYRERGFFPGRELFVLDPSGNRIELSDLTWRPGMPRPTFEEIVGS
jgi:catechol 2,3-dioxygenase-like lactoylglutathione lyase family enzyme